MSSPYVRDTIENFLKTSLPTENIVNLDGEFQDVEEFLDQNSVAMNQPWIGLQFVAGDEIPITIASGNSVGKYRETGAILLHVVDIAKLGVRTSILNRGEAIRNLLRGQRVGRIVIETVTPVNFASGATLQFEAGFTAGSIMASFVCDLDL